MLVSFQLLGKRSAQKRPVRPHFGSGGPWDGRQARVDLISLLRPRRKSQALLSDSRKIKSPADQWGSRKKKMKAAAVGEQHACIHTYMHACMQQKHGQGQNIVTLEMEMTLHTLHKHTTQTHKHTTQTHYTSVIERVI